MRGADSGIGALAGVEVVIDAVHAALLQPLGLPEVQQAGRDANLQSESRFHLRHDPAEGLQVALARAAARGDDAIRRGPELSGHSGPIEHLFRPQQIMAGDVGPRNPRLRAIAAIFAAMPALGVDQEVQVDAVAEPAIAHAVGSRQEIEQLAVVGAQQGQAVGGLQRAALEHSIGQGVPTWRRIREVGFHFNRGERWAPCRHDAQRRVGMCAWVADMPTRGFAA